MSTAQIVVPLEGRIRVRFPADDHGARRRLLNAGFRPKWDHQGQFWRVSRSRLDELKQFCRARYDTVDIWTTHKTTERCTPSCQAAKRDLCTCSCGGNYHKGGAPAEGWREVSNGAALVGQGDEFTVHRRWTREAR